MVLEGDFSSSLYMYFLYILFINVSLFNLYNIVFNLYIFDLVIKFNILSNQSVFVIIAKSKCTRI
jgi:hypothetical protein